MTVERPESDVTARPQGPLKLIGVKGFCEGEVIVLEDGEFVIGRSRSCDFSLRRCPRYLQADPKTRDDDHDFQTVSRRHLRLTVSADGTRVKVEDLGSSNGSYVCNEAIKTIVLPDLDRQCYELRMGTRETVRLQYPGVHALARVLPEDAGSDQAAVATEPEAVGDRAAQEEASPETTQAAPDTPDSCAQAHEEEPAAESADAGDEVGGAIDAPSAPPEDEAQATQEEESTADAAQGSPKPPTSGEDSGAEAGR